MKLTDLIKQLVQITAEVGDCNVFITTKKDANVYDTVLLDYTQYEDIPILRILGCEDTDFEDEEDCDLDEE